MAVTGSLDPLVTFNVALDEVTRQLDIDAASILYLNPYTQTLRYAAGRGFCTRSVEKTCLRLGEGLAGRAALEKRTVHVPNLSESSEFTRTGLFAVENFTAYYAVPLIAKGRVLGVLKIFHRLPHEGNSEWLEFLETLAGQIAIAIDNAELFHNLERSKTEITQAYDATIEALSYALDLKDKETEGHSQRVTELTLRIARKMRIKEEELVHIRRGALLHDIGKMGIPDDILLKPGKLTDEEWEIMRKHPMHAYQMLSRIEYLRPALDIPYCHHEKWDGTGYPRGLKGEKIPLAARIFSVVDVFDALINDRPYRKAWPKEKVLAELHEQSGKHFDPRVVEVFLSLAEKNLLFEEE
ncbi:MAG: HD domain-containing protein [Peptococcaceae bacterium]|nr:HD domain-containing protein [Peptococcaceae bacterium]